MLRRDFIRAGIATCGSAVLAAPVFGKNYPSGPVTVVLPLQAGSASDVAVRHAVTGLASRMAANFVVENLASAAGVVGLERLSRAKPDGQTIAALNNSILTILPHLQPQHVKIDTRTEFVPIAGIANIPTFFAVPGDSSIKSIKDLVEQARQSPGHISYSSGAVGSPQHLATEMFCSITGVKLLHVPYRGASQAALAVAAREVGVMSMALSLAKPFLADGRVRLIGYCGLERHSQYPDIPTLNEQGVSGYEYSSWVSLFAQKDVPSDIVAVLRKQAKAVVNDQALQTQLVNAGLDPWPRTPEQLSKIVKEDYAKWKKIVKDANIQQV
ncbi:MAG TPA: tripartite tricarboxylate transporter substrate binding protein [Eoetvoesiella sp.]